MASRRVLVNGRVFTANKEQPWAEAVVIEGNKIAFVGTSDEARAMAGETPVEDLGGKLMTPGLIDGHLHVFGVIVFDGLVSLAHMTPDEMLAAIKEDIDAHPERSAYTGLGWADDTFGEAGPSRYDLDAVCPDKPVAVMSASMHTLWCNSKALEVAGITKDTPDVDPDAGVLFVRDENGEPTGWAKEIASMTQVMSAAQYFDEETLSRAMDRFLEQCSGYGITSLFDCGALGFMMSLFNDALCAKFERDETPCRLDMCGYAGAAGLFDAALNDCDALHKRFTGDRLFCNFHKMFNDGTLESFSAAIKNPYPDGSVVKPAMTAEKLAERFEACAKLGLNVNVHAIGADAVHNVLEGAGIVRGKGYDDIRIICSHCTYVYPEDIAKFGEYNVFSNTTGLWIAEPADEETYELIKGLVEAKDYPMKSILAGGAHVGLGSDFPTDPRSLPPMQSIEGLVTRAEIGNPDGFAHDGDERLTMEQVLRGYTIENAWEMQREDVLGSIEVGKYADLAIFEQDLFEVEPHTIHDVQVAETIKDGLTTFKK